MMNASEIRNTVKMNKNRQLMCDDDLTSSTCACASAIPVAPPAFDFWDVLNVYKKPRHEDEWKKSFKVRINAHILY